MLTIENLYAGYGDIEVLRGVSLDVPQHSIVALLGSNGAGKSTTLKTAMGLLKARQGEVTFCGERITGKSTDQIVNAGLYLVPEWRGTFSTLSVLENLELGAFPRRARARKDKMLPHVFDIFPRLQERQSQKAGTLSGGERQMLAIGRALMACPEMLILDEPSLGLAPMIVELIFGVIQRINDEGVTILVVEQNVWKALNIADYAYILENGAITGHGPASTLKNDTQIQAAYLGL
ncbi:MAG: ABC transporter ATP-binding protein [Anaerolineae bacterium]|nr:ABC transporter ATP-binding protein [Anaerolineae bacterium]